MSWIIHPMTGNRWHIEDDGEIRGHILGDGHGGYLIHFPGAQSFDWRTQNFYQALGYVRGIETATRVHAQLRLIPRGGYD